MEEQTKKIRTAFVLGAGLGMRLRPLTEECPKPLLSVRGRPLVTYAMDHLLGIGVERFIVNTHHMAHRYVEAFPGGTWRGAPISFRFEPTLLDTGGGLKNIEDLLGEDEAVWVYNGDILTDLPLEKLLCVHTAGGCEVTLALRSTGPVQNVGLDAAGRICDFRGILGADADQSLQFTGIYIVERPFFRRLRAGMQQDIVPVFVEMVRTLPGSVGYALIDDGVWEDIGTMDAYAALQWRGPAPAIGARQGEDG